jgi:hypothetical protein
MNLNTRLATGALAFCCAALGATVAVPSAAHAFCGFYVSGATESLYNNATQVVMMREGTRTILSMQNSYEGPPGDFAMVIPVPVVLQKENVKTLTKDVFGKIDQMGAPRLVEYWETDPCYQPPPRDYAKKDGNVRRRGAVPTGKSKGGGGVVVEAQFTVGEYEVVILSASDSGGLDTWLRKNKYNIPQGAEAVLRPYVEAGTKFFVAKVNAKKVKFDGNRAILSPLRFHYDTKDFTLPIRLGLLNAKGHQDVIVHILARGQRYQAANYKNVTVPTNLIVDNDVRKRFGEFYAALFDETLAQNPKSVVTEYSWDASTCDPCPGPTLTPNDFQTFGADVTPSKNAYGFVLTRLHARYTSKTLGEDLVFEAAPPIVGGRGTPDQHGELAEKGSKPGGRNNFQGRYTILHPWEGAIACQTPIRGRWGGPPSGKGGTGTQAAMDLANAKRGGAKLTTLVRQDVPELKLETANKMPPLSSTKNAPASGPASAPDDAPASAPAKTPAAAEGDEESPSGSGCSMTTGAPRGGWLVLVLAGAALWIRRGSR